MNSFLKQFSGPNAAYVLDLYERYQRDPQSVDADTQAIFDRWKSAGFQLETALPTAGQAAESSVPAPAPISASPGIDPNKIAAVVNLAQAIRTIGHRAAQLDPLGEQPPGDPWLSLEHYALTEDDLRQIPAQVIGSSLAANSNNALDAINHLRRTYMTSTGYDYEHIDDPEERDWLREKAECGDFRSQKYPVDRLGLLLRLTQVEAFDQFLHRTFPGKTRFSIEGVDMMVPMLDVLLEQAAAEKFHTITIGMAHRGRLNVLAHILGKPLPQLLADFKDPLKQFPTRIELGWSGDVKYHKGARREFDRDEERPDLIVTLPPNPSHLEFIDPVVLGMTRAAGTQADHPGRPEFFPDESLAVLIHGDASFPGQGVVAETLNLSQLDGYTVGGAIHIIANNQLGYTTLPQDGRSTLYSSDLAKGFEIPVIHVNADDPESCIEAIRTAFAYRQRFHKDFVIDLIGYRRYGHNEGDEPSFTQPVMYSRITEHPSVRKIWGDRLVREDEVESDIPDQLLEQEMDKLQKVLAELEPERDIDPPEIQPPPRGAARKVKTAVPIDELRELNDFLTSIPDGFQVHRKLIRGLNRRKEIFENPDERSIDWATAEELALASILADKVPIRMTGEDVERGTFSQRHSVFHDTESGETYSPLQYLPQAGASFEIHNSPLSEIATIGFEFGYDISSPRTLVIWEAQYGDFINVAQAVIDEFILSARAKWEQTPSLVLLLPHGYEGQGPDHSTGRPERFLQSAADINFRLANCTTAAQYFHLLRRQAALLEVDPLPLVVLTPKSLLRHPLVASSPRELAEGHWQQVLDDNRAAQHPDQIERIILCSGKVYIDLISSDLWENSDRVAIIRIEQLYRFPEELLRQILSQYPDTAEVVWLQEEPKNMGGWEFIAPRLAEILGENRKLRYLGRGRSSSPAEGSSALHAARQSKIIEQAFDLQQVPVKEG